jgi:fatty-acyl-CoA synthase
MGSSDFPKITGILRYWSARAPRAAALECDGQTLTWRQLHYLSRTWAARLRADGLRPGDRVAYLTENRNETIVFILAALAADCVVVPLNVRLAGTEIAEIAADAGLSAVIVDAAYLDRLQLTRTARPDLHLYWAGAGGPGDAPRIELSTPADVYTAPLPREDASGPDQLAFLSYTSGTTGHPKAAMVSHRNFIAAAKAFALTDDSTRADVSLLVLPLAFTGSLIASWAPMYLSGACLVLHRRFSASAALAELRSGRIRIFYAVPVVFESISALPDFAAADLSAVRVMRSGGAPSTPATLRPYLDRGLPISVGWGQTESTGVGASLPSHDVERKFGSVGVPMLGIDIRVVGDGGRDAEPGIVGEVLLRGESLMQGYWNAGELTAATIVDGWLHTGDLGSLDEDGYLTVVGRSKDMLLSGGINVYPAEIERVLMGAPGVTEAAVVGRPDQRWGEVPVAFVVCDADGADVASLALVCKRELADYKQPRQIIIRREPLPRTMSGKIIKSALSAEIP